MPFERLQKRIDASDTIEPVPRCFLDADTLRGFDEMVGRVDFFAVIRTDKERVYIVPEGNDHYYYLVGKRRDDIAAEWSLGPF